MGHVFNKFTFKKSEEKRAGFHKSAAAIRLSVEVAQREQESATEQEEGEGKKGGIEYRQRNPKDGGSDSGGENGTLSPSPERRKSYLQPIHQHPATKFCLPGSLFSPTLSPQTLPTIPDASFSQYLSCVWRLQRRRQAARNDGIDIPLAENLHSLFIYQYNTPPCFFF